MRYIGQILILIILMPLAFQCSGQIQSVKYALAFNDNTQLYDCYLVVSEGSTSKIHERIQFNSQFSIVVPSRKKLGLVKTYMPIILNDNTPQKWVVSSKVLSPEVTPENDYYVITPMLAPTSLYEELKDGDVVKLFSIKVIGGHELLEGVRLYDNDSDPKYTDNGMEGADFSNGFTMGGTRQLYSGNMVLEVDVIGKLSLLLR